MAKNNWYELNENFFQTVEKLKKIYNLTDDENFKDFIKKLNKMNFSIHDEEEITYFINEYQKRIQEFKEDILAQGNSLSSGRYRKGENRIRNKKCVDGIKMRYNINVCNALKTLCPSNNHYNENNVNFYKKRKQYIEGIDYVIDELKKFVASNRKHKFVVNNGITLKRLTKKFIESHFDEILALEENALHQFTIFEMEGGENL